MSNKTKAQVQALAIKLGVTMEEDCNSHSWDVTFYTDDSREFDSSSASCLCIYWYATPGAKGEFWQECYTELACGVA